MLVLKISSWHKMRYNFFFEKNKPKIKIYALNNVGRILQKKI